MMLSSWNLAQNRGSTRRLPLNTVTLNSVCHACRRLQSHVVLQPIKAFYQTTDLPRMIAKDVKNLFNTLELP